MNSSVKEKCIFSNPANNDKMTTVKCPLCHEEKRVNHKLNIHYTDETGKTTTMTDPMMWQHCVSTKCFRNHFIRLDGRFDANFHTMLHQIKQHFIGLADDSSTTADLKARKKTSGIWWNIIMNTNSTKLAVKVMTAMSCRKMEEVADEIDDDLIEDITASRMVGWFRPRDRRRTTPETTEVRVQSDPGISRETYLTRESVNEIIEAAVAAATAPLLAELKALNKKKKKLKLVVEL
jgi:hypothetical protein